jgi:hypothetical protein
MRTFNLLWNCSKSGSGRIDVYALQTADLVRKAGKDNLADALEFAKENGFLHLDRIPRTDRNHFPIFENPYVLRVDFEDVEAVQFALTFNLYPNEPTSG